MKISVAACLAALLIASCGSGSKRTTAPVHEGTVEPVPTGQAAPSDPAGKMEPDEVALVHIARVINIMRDLMHDCEAAHRKAMEYVAKNIQPILEGLDYGQSKEKALQGQAKDDYDAEMKALLNELAPDYEKVLESFGDVCPDQKHAIGSAMGL